MMPPTPSARATTPSSVHAALFFVAFLFGANYVIAKFALREVNPTELVALRTWGTAVILFAASWLHRRKSPVDRFTAADFGQLALYSLLGVTINQLCFLEGLSRTTATNASIMLVSIPLFTLTFALLLKRERATLTGIVGIALGLAGALLMIMPRGTIDFSSKASVGNLLLLISGMSYALYLVLTRPILSRHDPLRVVSWVFLFAALMVTPFAFGDLRTLISPGITQWGWASVAYVTIAATAVPYLLNNWALVRVKSSIVAVYVLLQPVVAGIMGRWFFSETLAPHTALAAAMVIAGVILVGWRRE